MSSLKLEDKWLREQEDWDKNGDPAFDPDLDRDTVLQELQEKAERLKLIQAEADKTFKELFKEVFGQEPPTFGEITISLITMLIVKKFGKDAIGAVTGLLDAFKPVDSALIDPVTKQPFKTKPPVGKTLGKTLVKRQVIITVLLGLVAIGGAEILRRRLSELFELEKKLRRAMRWEALTIDDQTDNEIYESQAYPPKEIIEKLEANNRCNIFMEITVRGFDAETGAQIERVHEMAKAKKGNDGLFTRTINLPVNICFGSVITKIVLFCNETPPKRTVLHESEVPYRTSADCSESRGKLTSDG